MSCRTEASKSTELILTVMILPFMVLVPRVRAAAQDRPEQDASATDSLRTLEQRVDQLSALLEELRAEVKRSHQESQQLRLELDTTRAQLSLLAKTDLTRTSKVDGNIVSKENAQADPQTAQSPADERLEKLEENQQLLQSKIDDQYQTKVESSSKYRVKLSGIALLNIFGTHGNVDNADLPNYARERGPLDSSGSFGASVRQSMLGLDVFGPKLAGARTSAKVQVDFFGGFPQTPDGITAGLVRLRTATMQLDWKRTSIVAGQDEPFFSPLSPTSLASLANPAFAYAGNLWTWTPQVRVEHRVPLTEGSNLVIEGGIMDALTGEIPYSQAYRNPQAGERSGQPAYGARIAWSRSAWKQPLSFGGGSYYARQNWGFGRNVDAWAATADWQVPAGPWFALSGEFYRGRGVGGLGAAEGRSVTYNGPLTSSSTSVVGLDTAGGWAQLKYSPIEKLEFNTAFGEDVPYARDLAYSNNSNSYVASGLGRNESGFFNVIYRPRSNIVFSAEYRKLWTFETYETLHRAGLINLSMGVLF